MDKLWEKRRKPVPLSLDHVLDGKVPEVDTSVAGTSHAAPLKKEVDVEDQKLWTLKESFDAFRDSVSSLKNRLRSQTTEDKFLVWDKDDAEALSFVTAVSNIRSHIFGIEKKSRFEVKSMAGNIIPAISSTNAIISGVIASQSVNLLRAILSTEKEDLRSMNLDEKKQVINSCCKAVFLRTYRSNCRSYLSAYQLFEPNNSCLVCSSNTREIEILLDLSQTTIGYLGQEICIKKLNFVEPEITLEGQAVILWSKEEADEEGSEYSDRLLSEIHHLKQNTRLKVDDMLQNTTIIMTLKNESIDPNENDGFPFKMVVTNEGAEETTEDEKKEEDPKSRDSDTQDVDDEDEIQEVDNDTHVEAESSEAPKRKAESEPDSTEVTPPKRKPCPKSKRLPDDPPSEAEEEIVLSSDEEVENVSVPVIVTTAVTDDENSDDSDCCIILDDHEEEHKKEAATGNGLTITGSNGIHNEGDDGTSDSIEMLSLLSPDAMSKNPQLADSQATKDDGFPSEKCKSSGDSVPELKDVTANDAN